MMKWKNFKIRTKLNLAFGSVIILLIVIGTFSLYNIVTIGNEATSLSDKYLPLTILSNNITTSVQKVEYTEKNYSITFQQSMLDDGKKYLDSLKTYLQEAKKIAEKFDDLKDFNTAIDATEKILIDYDNNIKETQQISQKLKQNQERIQQLRQDFITESNSYLSIQRDLINYSLRNGANSNLIKDCIYKIDQITGIVTKVNNCFYQVLKSESSGSVKDLSSAISIFGETENQLNGLLAISRRQNENSQLTIVKSNITDSKAALTENNAYYSRIGEITKTDKDLSAKLVDNFKTVSSQSMANSRSSANNTIKKVENSKQAVIIGLVIVIIVSLIFANYITRSVTKSIKKGVAFAQQVAAGNLEAELDISQKDEIGQLAMALKEMVDKLRTIIDEILISAESINEASVGINSHAQTMANGASRQASAAQEVSSSMDEMVASIHQNTENSKATEKISVIAADEVKKGSETTKTAADSMKKIAEKIGIINDIAFQTNILALNAAVEAARAGEHGRGFAVVAAEVRKLAERSKLAAEEIDQLSKSGVKISEEAGKQLVSIVPEIEKTAKLIQEISAASIEQNAGADQINSALQQLNQITQQNASASDSMAASADDLSKHANRLKEIVQYFNLKKTVKQKTIKKETSFSTKQTSVQTNKIIAKPTQPVIKKVEIKQNSSIQKAKPVSTQSQEKQELPKIANPIIKKQQILNKQNHGAYINLGSTKKATVSDDEYEQF